MRDEKLLYGPRDYTLADACERIAELVRNISNPRILLWTNPKGFDTENTRFGEREVERGYRSQEENFINELQEKGDRWRWDRATNTDELQKSLRAENFHAVVILGTSPTNILRKGVYYLDSIGEGPKPLLLEFNLKHWDEAETYALWHYLDRTGHLHLLRNFVHLTTRKSARKYLPSAAKKMSIGSSVPIWEIPAHRITADHVEHLFTAQLEEGGRLDYKRAAALSEKKKLDHLVERICAFANSKGGTIVIGIIEVDGLPLLPITKGLENVAQPDGGINRLLQKLANVKSETPDIETRTITLRSRTIVVLQIGESISKQCGMRLGADQKLYVPIRRDRITDWLSLYGAADSTS
jgi:hypothetical protein